MKREAAAREKKETTPEIKVNVAGAHVENMAVGQAGLQSEQHRHRDAEQEKHPGEADHISPIKHRRVEEDQRELEHQHPCAVKSGGQIAMAHGEGQQECDRADHHQGLDPRAPRAPAEQGPAPPEGHQGDGVAHQQEGIGEAGKKPLAQSPLEDQQPEVKPKQLANALAAGGRHGRTTAQRPAS
jgi:hypothetical protein